jgi:endonuclease YncB( thermonuclease family)
MKKKLYLCVLIVFALIFLVLPFFVNASTIKCVDGDTFSIGKKFYRLSYIDTPEKNQANYKQASKFTCNWLKTNEVILEHQGKDKYGRTLVVVWKAQRSYTDATPGENINELLVKNCLAKPFYGKTNKTILSLYNKCK